MDGEEKPKSRKRRAPREPGGAAGAKREGARPPAGQVPPAGATATPEAKAAEGAKPDAPPPKVVGKGLACGGTLCRDDGQRIIHDITDGTCSVLAKGRRRPTGAP